MQVNPGCRQTLTTWRELIAGFSVVDSEQTDDFPLDTLSVNMSKIILFPFSSHMKGFVVEKIIPVYPGSLFYLSAALLGLKFAPCSR